MRNGKLVSFSKNPDGKDVTAMSLMVFAAAFMVVGGIFHFLNGLAAVINDHFFVIVDGYAYNVDVTVWGWLHIITGVILTLVGVNLLTGKTWARLVAVLMVVCSAMLNFVYIPYQPLWSIVLLVMDGVLLWALITSPDIDSEAV